MRIVIFSFFCLSFLFAKAQESQNNFYEKSNFGISFLKSEIVSQTENEIKIRFRIKNNDSIKSGIKYGLDLLNEKGLVEDKKICDESLVLLSGEEIEKEISYFIPEYLNGNYLIIIFSNDENGSHLGFGNIGSVFLSGNSKFLEIDEKSCFLNVEGEDSAKKYKLEQGVDVRSNEKLLINCNVTNHFNSDVSFSPVFKTYKRSVYGENVSEKQEFLEQSFHLKSGEIKQVSFVVPKVNVPQSYDAVLSFTDGQKKISNEVISHYVISGQSSNILDLSIDKDFYNKGEKAEISFFITGSADSFPDSRLGGNKLENATTEILILNSKNKNCVEPIKNNLKTGNNEFSVEVVEICSNPKVKVIAKDINGNVLNESEMNIESKSILKEGNKAKIITFKDFKKYLLFLTILLPVILAIFILCKKIKKNKIPPTFGLFIFLGVTFLFFSLGSKSVQAFGTPTLISPLDNAELTGVTTFSWTRPLGFTPSGDTMWYELIFEENGSQIWNSGKIYDESVTFNIDPAFQDTGIYTWKIIAKSGYNETYETSQYCSVPSWDGGCNVSSTCTNCGYYCNEYSCYNACPVSMAGDYGYYTSYQPCTPSFDTRIIITEIQTSSSRTFTKYGARSCSGATSLVCCADGDCENGDAYYWHIVPNLLGQFIYESPGSFLAYTSVTYIGCRNGGGWIGAFYKLETAEGKPIPGFESSYNYQGIWGYQTINLPSGIPTGNYKIIFKLHGHYDLNSYRYYCRDFQIISSGPTITIDPVSPIFEGESTTLIGRMTASAGKTVSSASWSCSNGGTISNVNNTGIGTANATSTATYTAPSFDGSPTKTDTCTLSATDNTGATGSGTVSITVNCEKKCSEGCGGGSDTCGGLCSLVSPIDGDCGEAVGECDFGNPIDVKICGKEMCWQCEGVCGGDTVSCSAKRDMNWKEVTP